MTEFTYRPELAEYAHGAFTALLNPDDPGGLGYAERALVASLADPSEHEGRLAAILRHARLVAIKPTHATSAALQTLREYGLNTRDIVVLHQIVAFTSYRTRVSFEPTRSTVRESTVEFTRDELTWRSWLDTVDPESATASQLAVLDESGKLARQSPYYLTLVHDEDSLRERSRLYNAVMFGRGGLPRPERELAATVVSWINGCVYCASVHGRRHAQLTKRAEIIDGLFASGPASLRQPCDRAIAAVAAAVTAGEGVDTEPLSALGFAPDSIGDVIQVSALFAWANRLMLTLGEPVRTDRQR